MYKCKCRLYILWINNVKITLLPLIRSRARSASLLLAKVTNPNPYMQKDRTRINKWPCIKKQLSQFVKIYKNKYRNNININIEGNVSVYIYVLDTLDVSLRVYLLKWPSVA